MGFNSGLKGLKFNDCFRSGIMQGALVLTHECNLSLLLLMFILRRSKNIRLFSVGGKERLVN